MRSRTQTFRLSAAIVAGARAHGERRGTGSAASVSQRSEEQPMSEDGSRERSQDGSHPAPTSRAA